MPGWVLPDIAAELHAAAVGEGRAQHRRIGTRRSDSDDRIAAGRRVADDVEIRLRIEDAGDAAAYQLVTIDNEDPSHVFTTDHAHGAVVERAGSRLPLFTRLVTFPPRRG